MATLSACGGQAPSVAPAVKMVELTASASVSARAPVIPPLPHASASARPADPVIPHLARCVLHAGGRQSRAYSVKPSTIPVPGQPGTAVKPIMTVTRMDDCWFNAECGTPGQTDEGDGDASIRCHDAECECVVGTRPAQGEPVRFSFTETGACDAVETLLIDRCMAGASVSNDPRKKP